MARAVEQATAEETAGLREFSQMRLSIDLYDEHCRRARRLFGNDALWAFTPVTFASNGYPVNITDEGELIRFVDPMKETISRNVGEADTFIRVYSLRTRFTEAEAELKQLLCASSHACSGHSAAWQRSSLGTSRSQVRVLLPRPDQHELETDIISVSHGVSDCDDWILIVMSRSCCSVETKKTEKALALANVFRKYLFSFQLIRWVPTPAPLRGGRWYQSRGSSSPQYGSHLQIPDSHMGPHL
jgi:hypothetical protein